MSKKNYYRVPEGDRCTGCDFLYEANFGELNCTLYYYPPEHIDDTALKLDECKRENPSGSLFKLTSVGRY
jgi:hypothetical protein